MSDPTQSHQKPDANGKKYWLDDNRNVDKVFWSVISVCAVLMVAEFFYHKHPAMGFDGNFGFYGFYGFFGSIGLVLVAKELRKFLMRGEDYYDTGKTDGEDDS